MTRPTVLMPSRMHDVVVEGCEERFELIRLWEAADPDAVLAERGADVRGLATGGHHTVDAALLDRLPNLQIVANFGVGYDTVDCEAATARGEFFTANPGVLDVAVADNALGLMLMSVSGLGCSEQHLRD